MSNQTLNKPPHYPHPCHLTLHAIARPALSLSLSPYLPSTVKPLLKGRRTGDRSSHRTEKAKRSTATATHFRGSRGSASILSSSNLGQQWVRLRFSSPCSPPPLSLSLFSFSFFTLGNSVFCVFARLLIGFVEFSSREMMGPIEANAACTASPYNLHIGYGLPLSGTTTVDTSAMFRMYGSPVTDSLPPRTPLKSDSCLSYNIPLSSRKRSRDFSTQVLPCTMPRRDMCCSSSFSFLGEDFSLQIQQQQLDVDRLIAHHVSSSFSLVVAVFL